MKALFTKVLLGLCFAFSVLVSAQETDTVPQELEVGENVNSERHKILLEAVKATEMDVILENSGPFTVFAPSDAAFQRFSNGRIEELLNSKDKSELKTLLGYHIVAGHLTASRMLRAMCRGNGKASFTTIQGKKLVAHLEGYDIILTDSVGNTARITTADVSQGNRVIHEIDSVIVPTRMWGSLP
ncbi:fasciclin domain-containing protein [Flagellimonas myxillae]|uniref:fasciclin domain-containing protein n=1 Tax=Flagellimonas myxillae TaxID=2942214 RepID=UPI00201EE0F7|nr:fasciclin domain-containing protein [Muricauda myxillae]MCL6265715.1 fasciclin domain-containing protein [Muricauda myxillae]